jgi:hypothetical protein
MMNGVAAAGLNNGLPATAVLRLASDRPMTARKSGSAEGDEVLLASVTHPPRIGETRPIAALMPEVLARYGLGEAINGNTPSESAALDLLA